MLLSLIADYKLPLYLISISTKIKALEIMDKQDVRLPTRGAGGPQGASSLGVKKHH